MVNEIQILNLAREVFCFCLKKKKNETKEQNNLRLYNYIAIYIKLIVIISHFVPRVERLLGTRLEPLASCLLCGVEKLTL